MSPLAFLVPRLKSRTSTWNKVGIVSDSPPTRSFAFSMATLLKSYTQHLKPIRLSGIDRPEKGQAYGQKAKQAATVLMFG